MAITVTLMTVKEYLAAHGEFGPVNADDVGRRARQISTGADLTMRWMDGKLGMTETALRMAAEAEWQVGLRKVGKHYGTLAKPFKGITKFCSLHGFKRQHVQKVLSGQLKGAPVTKAWARWQAVGAGARAVGGVAGEGAGNKVRSKRLEVTREGKQAMSEQTGNGQSAIGNGQQATAAGELRERLNNLHAERGATVIEAKKAREEQGFKSAAFQLDWQHVEDLTRAIVHCEAELEQAQNLAEGEVARA